MTFTSTIHTLIDLFSHSFRGFERHELYSNLSSTFPTTVYHQFTKCVFQGSTVILASPNFRFKLMVFAGYKQEYGLMAQTSAGQMLLQSSSGSNSRGSIDRNAGSQPTITLAQTIVLQCCFLNVCPSKAWSSHGWKKVSTMVYPI